jgi:hypothetical protein
VYFVLTLGMFPRLGHLRVWDKLTAWGSAALAGPDLGKALRELRRWPRGGPAW